MFYLSFTYGTHNPALLVLQSKGYFLSISRCDEPSAHDSIYIATAPGRRFTAYGAAELLGLVAIWEHFGENWNHQEPDLLGELPEEPDQET